MAAIPFLDAKIDSFVTVQEVCEPEFTFPSKKQMIIDTRTPAVGPNSFTTAGSSTSSSTPTTATSTESHQWEEDLCQAAEQPAIRRCPFVKEFQEAQAHHPILASTGCTKNFCQAGRAVHTNEPRVGENRALDLVEKEAEGFLRELHQEGFFDNEEAFVSRLDSVLTEIRSGARDGVVRESDKRGAIGGNWYQTPAELEFGIRRSWRNARKCIMRSHSDELKLCDLRKVVTSAEMASELVRNMCEAFNSGNVLPTVFVFPPRQIDSRGPMIWNHQMLEFAGYEMDDGTILGDPNSTGLTKAIIDLGWTPPSPRSRWDLLPLVIMADGDVPAMVEMPLELSRLVEIRHPRYSAEFEKLDLKWVTVPALTRLGFDIGGVQYTAAPFIGWFMDAEIGVRDLADTFRYNALPDIAQALGLIDTTVEGIEGLDDLLEYERLSVLSRSQQELNYAVHWSYQQAKVSMSDTLTASTKWCRYDDDFKAKNGYRLPADPYWLAPPQGSIVPVWHRGGAPNYQPKPLICRHVQDPLKAWGRQKVNLATDAKLCHYVDIQTPDRPLLPGKSSSSYCVVPPPQIRDESHGELPTGRTTLGTVCVSQGQISPAEPPTCLDRQPSSSLSVAVFFCSAGTFAEKVAVKLTDRLRDLAQGCMNLSMCPAIQPLDHLQASTIPPGSIVLLVVSSTGQGEVPANGSRFIAMCDREAGKRLTSPQRSFRYAIYGNGDSRYAATYNGAAHIVDQRLRQIGGLTLAGGLHQGDTAVATTALQALNSWWTKLRPAIQDLASDSPKLRRANSDNDFGKGPKIRTLDCMTEAISRHQERSKRLCTDYHDARIANVNPSYRENHQGTYSVTLDIGARRYQDMGCIQVLPINSPAKVRRALRALGVSGSALLHLDLPGTNEPLNSAFLTEYVDLESPFANLDWLQSLGTNSINDDKFTILPCLDVLEHLHSSGHLPADNTLTTTVLLALPPLHPRTYSIASSLSYPTTPSPKATVDKPSNQLTILTKPLPTGRFSHTFLATSVPRVPLRYRLLPSPPAEKLLTIPPITPLIIIATGAGFAPVQCYLQRRIAASHSSQPPDPNENKQSISLFLGLKPADISLFAPILNEAAAIPHLLSQLCIVPSNTDGVRVYDRILEEGTREKMREMVVEKRGWVFVCTGIDAAKGTRRSFENLLEGGGGVEEMEREGRWVEEVY